MSFTRISLVVGHFLLKI